MVGIRQHGCFQIRIEVLCGTRDSDGVGLNFLRDPHPFLRLQPCFNGRSCHLRGGLPAFFRLFMQSQIKRFRQWNMEIADRRFMRGLFHGIILWQNYAIVNGSNSQRSAIGCQLLRSRFNTPEGRNVKGRKVGSEKREV